jgi:tRNA1Val (adenine37-N6)-methyltransferase
MRKGIGMPGSSFICTVIFQRIDKVWRICLILPVNEGIKCVQFAESIGLYCHKMVYVHPKPATEAKRVLLQFSDSFKPTEISKLEIETTERHQYSKEFAALAKDFYLKL